MLIILWSAVCAYLITPNTSFPYLGMAIFLSSATLIVYFSQIPAKRSQTYFALALLSSLSFLFRSEPSIIYLNFVSVIYLNAISILTTNKINLTTLISAPLVVFGEIIRFSPKNKNANISLKHFYPILLTILILFVTIPMLSNSNPIFSNLVSKYLTSWLKFDDLGPLWIPRIFLATLISTVFLQLVRYQKQPPGVANITITKLPENLLIPQVTITLVLVVFVLTQIALYTASGDTLAYLGYTNSRQTREIFGQMATISFIIFTLIYNDSSKRKVSIVLRPLLITLASLMILFSYKSDLEYIYLYGFTYKRLYGLFLALWICSIYIIHIKFNHRFVHYTSLVSATIILIMTLANFDYLIFNFKKSSTPSGPDYQYLGYLSADSLSWHTQFDNFSQTLRDPKPLDYRTISSASIILRRVTDLNSKYSNFDLRTFNFLEYLQYTKTKYLGLKPTDPPFANLSTLIDKHYDTALPVPY